MEGFFVIEAWIINLKDSSLRRKNMQERISALAKNQIIFHFFDAISFQNDKRFELYKKHWNCDKLCQLYWGRVLTSGEKACFASHYALWQKCIALDQAILIFEDDIEFKQDFLQKLENIVQSSFEFVRFLSLAQNSYVRIDDAIVQDWSGCVCGTQGYFLTPSAARKFLKRSQKWICPVDNFLDKFYFHGVKSLYCSPYIVEPDGMESCIGLRDAPPPIAFQRLIRKVGVIFETLWRKLYEQMYRK